MPVTSPDEAIARAMELDGWLHPSQAQTLWCHAAAVSPPGTVVEIGSYRGRSTTVLAAAVADGVEVVAIDPHAGNDRGPYQWHGTYDEGEGDFARFHGNLAAAGVADRVRHVRRRSGDALDDVDGDVDVLFVDGAHAYRAARADIDRWGARVSPGGTMLVHDAYLSVGVTLAIFRSLVPGTTFRFAGRTRSLVYYRRERIGGRARLRHVMSHIPPLAWFGRNLVIRAALLCRLPAVARVLGHRGGPLC